MANCKILFVGCGKMGGALLGGLVKVEPSASEAALHLNAVKGSAEKNLLASEAVLHVNAVKGSVGKAIISVSPNKSGEEFGVQSYAKLSDVPNSFKPNIILLAVKPQIMEKVLTDYKKYDDGKTLFISIAAGKKISFFADILSEKTPIVRAMPNIPSLYGDGVTSLVKNCNVSAEQANLVDEIFTSVGESYWLDDECLIDVATALAGSGPAYIFHLFECLIDSAVSHGLPKEMATKMAINTVLGSAKMANNSDKNVTELKNQVISPNGTTQAGIDVLIDNNTLRDLIDATINAATNRSKELAD